MLGKALIGLGVGTAALGLGAAAGAYAGQTENNAATGATVGAATGLGLGVGALTIGANAGKIASGVGKGTVSLGKKAWGVASSNVTREMLVNGAKATGVGVMQAGVLAGKGAGALANVGAIGAVKAGAKYSNIAASMFKLNPDFKNLDNPKGGMLKLTKRGAAMIGIGAAVSAGVSAFKAFDSARAGVSDGQIVTATPTAARSSNMRNAGATGDLAFAMRAQRHG